jgi:hypothetical protein
VHDDDATPDSDGDEVGIHAATAGRKRRL